jgi:hypothetical protein
MQVALGTTTFEVAPLKLGDARLSEDVRADILVLLAMKGGDGAFPTPAQINAMVTVVFVCAHRANEAVTREAVAAAADDMDLLDGMTTLSKIAGQLIAPRAGASSATGEAPSPAPRSISSGSTASSSPQPDGATAPLTT